MHLEEFSQGHSFFHRLDARIKFIVFLPLVFVIALFQNIATGFLSLFLAVIFILLARIPFDSLFRRLVVVNLFVLFLWLALPFSVEGEALFSLGRFEFSREGFIYTLSITLKANAIFLFTVSILGTSEIFSLVHALHHLKFPKELTYLFFFFYRYISVLHREYDSLFSAIKVRGFIPRTNLHTWRTYAYLVGMLFIRSYERSRRIYQALLLRGFRGDFPLISHFRLKRKDLLFAFSMYAIIISLIIWKR